MTDDGGITQQIRSIVHIIDPRMERLGSSPQALRITIPLPDQRTQISCWLRQESVHGLDQARNAWKCCIPSLQQVSDRLGKVKVNGTGACEPRLKHKDASSCHRTWRN